ncbi:MAG: iron-sulfur cluster assembly protein [Thermoplasmata archaeon]
MAPNPERREKATPPDGPLEIAASPEAIVRLTEALHGLAPGHGVRIWVETGIHPKVRMMFDRQSPRDIAISVGAVPVFVDSLSRRFLEGARIEFVRQEGQEGFHVSGPNVPGGATEEPPPVSSPPVPSEAAAGSASIRSGHEEKIRKALKQIFDPEIPMNLVDLGLIYGFDWTSDDSVTIRMTLTSVGCPSTEQICEEVERAAREATGLPEVKIDVVWQPPWTPERMSLFAKRQFGYV